MILDEGNENAEGARAVSDVVVQSMNTYDNVSRNNMDSFDNHGLVDEKDYEVEFHALDNYIITKDVANFANFYFKEEIDSGSIFEDEELLNALLGRTTNVDDVKEIFENYIYG